MMPTDRPTPDVVTHLYRDFLKNAPRDNTTGLPHNVWAMNMAASQIWYQTWQSQADDRNTAKGDYDKLAARIATLESRSKSPEEA